MKKQQSDIIRSMISHVDNEYIKNPWGSTEEKNGFIDGVMWSIKKLQKDCNFEDNNVDLDQLYKELWEKYSRKS